MGNDCCGNNDLQKRQIPLIIQRQSINQPIHITIRVQNSNVHRQSPSQYIFINQQSKQYDSYRNIKDRKVVNKNQRQQTYPQNPSPKVAQQDMTRELYYQTVLKDKGIHQDYILHPEYFKACVCCQCQYGQNLKPFKLDCGHLICQKCRKEQKYCLIYNCEKGKYSINGNVFNEVKLLTQKRHKNNQQFDIVLSIHKDNRTKNIDQRVNGSQKIRDIIQKNGKNNKLFQIDQHAQLTIGRSSGKYSQIKDLKFSELSQIYDFQPVQSGKINYIKYYYNQFRVISFSHQLLESIQISNLLLSAWEIIVSSNHLTIKIFRELFIIIKKKSIISLFLQKIPLNLRIFQKILILKQNMEEERV